MLENAFETRLCLGQNFPPPAGMGPPAAPAAGTVRAVLIYLKTHETVAPFGSQTQLRWARGRGRVARAGCRLVRSLVVPPRSTSSFERAAWWLGERRKSPI